MTKKSVTAEKVTTLEEQREGEVVAEEEVVKVEAGGGGEESGRACGAEGRGVGEGGGQRRWRRKIAKTVLSSLLQIWLLKAWQNGVSEFSSMERFVCL